MATQRILVTGKAGHWIVKHLVERGYVRRFLANVKDFRSELVDRAALISNRWAKQVLGWKQEFFLR